MSASTRCPHDGLSHGSVRGKGGTAYQRRAVFGLETQHCPDSPSQKAFPKTALYPGPTYESTMEYRFSLR